MSIFLANRELGLSFHFLKTVQMAAMAPTTAAMTAMMMTAFLPTPLLELLVSAAAEAEADGVAEEEMEVDEGTKNEVEVMGAMLLVEEDDELADDRVRDEVDEVEGVLVVEVAVVVRLVDASPPRTPVISLPTEEKNEAIRPWLVVVAGAALSVVAAAAPPAPPSAVVAAAPAVVSAPPAVVAAPAPPSVVPGKPRIWRLMSRWWSAGT